MDTVVGLLVELYRFSRQWAGEF